RAWALQQPWCSRGPSVTSGSFSSRLRAARFVLLRGFPRELQDRVDFDVYVTEVRRLKAFLGTGAIEVLVFNWHTNLFAGSWPNYGIRSGFRAAVDELQALGAGVVPYTLIEFWDIASDAFQQFDGPSRAAKDENDNIRLTDNVGA